MTLRLASMLAPVLFTARFAGAQTPAQSPLADYPGFGHNRQADHARLIQQVNARERATAQCMQQAGFQYTPKTLVTGLVREARPQRRPGPDANQRYAASLPADRRTQYYLALFGVPDPNDESNLWDPRSSSGGGCWGEAMRAVPSVYRARSQLMEQYNALLLSIGRDARVQAARQREAECMRGRGLGNYASLEAVLSAMDRAAVERAPREQVDAHRQALAASRACRVSAGIDNILAEVRGEKEAEFTRANKTVLDEHRGRQRSQTLP